MFIILIYKCMGRCPYGEVSVWGGVRVGKCPYGEVSVWGGVRMGRCPMGRCPMGRCPMGRCPYGEVSVWGGVLELYKENLIVEKKIYGNKYMNVICQYNLIYFEIVYPKDFQCKRP